MLSTLRTTGTHEDFQSLVRLLDADLNRRYGALQKSYNAYNTSLSIQNVLVIYEDRAPIGCGAFKPFDQAAVEIKRMFIRPEYRGRGLASRVLSELEAWASELGYSASTLETGRGQPEAIALYTSQHYHRVENFGQYAGNPNSLCFRKPLRG